MLKKNDHNVSQFNHQGPDTGTQMSLSEKVPGSFNAHRINTKKITGSQLYNSSEKQSLL